MGALALFDGVFELSDRMQAIAVRALPVVETDVPWPMSGARTFPVWLAARAHLTRARAQRVTRLARALRDELPLTSLAVVQGGQGRVSVEQASAAPNARSRASCAAPSSPGTNIARSRGAPPRRAGAKATIPSTGFVIRGIPTPDPERCCAGNHDYVHDNGIQIAWKPGSGRQFTDHHGTTLHR